MLVPLLERPDIRNDRAGSGKFLASRGDRVHFGADYYAYPKQPISLTRAARYIKEGRAYASTAKYHYLEFQDRDFFIRYFYVSSHLPSVVKGTTIAAGIPFGHVQDIAAYYPDSGMQNHVHVSVHKNGDEPIPGFVSMHHVKKNRTYFNPEDYLEGKL